jgi:DNA-directed RNA polymerase subunit RPC12/RpoP
MEKRLSFKCWNVSCQKTYSLFKEITSQQELIIACPYCGAEAIVKLEPYRHDKKSVMRGEAGGDQAIGYEYQFPDVIPTQKPQ